MASTLVEYSPTQFYQLVELINKFDQAILDGLKDWVKRLDEERGIFKKQLEDLEHQNQVLLKESLNTTKQNPFKRTSDPTFVESLKGNFRDQNFIKIVFDIVSGTMQGYDILKEIGEGIRPTRLMTSGSDMHMKTKEDFQAYLLDTQMNNHQISRFMGSVFSLDALPKQIVNLGYSVSSILEDYNSSLRHRHSTEGIKIHRDPIITDLAISIFRNTDADGEIEDGRNANEISVYSVRKATILTESIKNGWLGAFIQEPSTLMDFIKIRLEELWTVATALSVLVKPFSAELRYIIGKRDTPDIMSSAAFKSALTSIDDLNPMRIKFKEKMGLLSSEERHQIEYKNQTIESIVSMLTDKEKSPDEIVAYILGRKEQLRRYNLEQNSFYVCKIDSGNAFLGESPGALTVIPGVRPTTNLEDVIGTGFDEARTFIDQIDSSNVWSDLYLATSPSKKTNKTNVLLIGPQGCGKTEVLRGVANRQGIIGVFAQASDFLTCWKGEMEKNPKRLFESALKLHQDSSRNVYILIDEIDTILNSSMGQASFGGTNLSSEFQMLMDGIMTYSGLAIWGASNHPDRIPDPVLRRFAKVLIVGELEQNHRVQLLKKYCGYMPISAEVDDTVWEDSAKRLEGAVGDIIRKVVDHVWRTKMTWFIKNHKDVATEVVKEINSTDVKFDIANFTNKQRGTLIERLRPYVTITPADLSQSIDTHLGNLAIQREIETCVETYKLAREFVDGL